VKVLKVRLLVVAEKEHTLEIQFALVSKVVRCHLFNVCQNFVDLRIQNALNTKQ
jgi:hypothetical protein